MASTEPFAAVTRILADAGVALDKIDERAFPGEKWLIIWVPEQLLTVAQSLAGSLEQTLNSGEESDAPYAVAFRPRVAASAPTDDAKGQGRLVERRVTQLIQLLEARSRASDALPSLKYVEDPRASLAAVATTRHHFVYGRRGVGKTSLLLEAKRVAEREGHVAVWLNSHTLGELDISGAFSVIAENVLLALFQRGGSSTSSSFARLERERLGLAELRASGKATPESIALKLPDLNQALRAVLRSGIMRLYLFLDDFYFIPMGAQPRLLHNVAGMLRDCDGWLKVASIERLTRPFEPSSRVGLESPHDASQIDLDVTLEDPDAAQSFLESVLTGYTVSAGINQPSIIAKTEALGRLVLASGGVPRDYLNLFASSIVVARQSRSQPQEIGREDVAKAAGIAARRKKRDLAQDVSSERSDELLTALVRLTGFVKKSGYTYFRVNMSEKGSSGYELLAQLVDMRFAHLVQASLSDQHRAGTKYEAYVLDLSEYTDVRLKRRLEILDLEDGKWTRRLTGKAQTKRELTGTQFRDLLRLSPLVPVDAVIVHGINEETSELAESQGRPVKTRAVRLRSAGPSKPRVTATTGVRTLIADLAKLHPNWDAAQIYETLRKNRHDISQGMVELVLGSLKMAQNEPPNVQLELIADRDSTDRETES